MSEPPNLRSCNMSFGLFHESLAGNERCSQDEDDELSIIIVDDTAKQSTAQSSSQSGYDEESM
jgi:hypothetical protein